MKPQQLLLPIFLFFIAQNLNAQTFKAGITAGVNWTQIDGDDVGGFTKPGLYAGVISEIPLAQNWGLAFEILSRPQRWTYLWRGCIGRQACTIQIHRIEG